MLDNADVRRGKEIVYIHQLRESIYICEFLHKQFIDIARGTEVNKHESQ